MSRQVLADCGARKSAHSSSGFRIVDGRHASPAAVLRLLEETGFLYPDKRARMNMDEVRETLEALWTAGGDPTLKTLLLAGQDGLHGHLSALRVYERTWSYQHLAASRRGAAAQGGKQLVLAGVGLAERAPQMTWLKAWYRPENAWPDRTFGSLARRVDDPARSHFAVYDYWVAEGVPGEEPHRAQLAPASAEDRAFIEVCFAARGEPALQQADDLTRDGLGLPGVERDYAVIGLTRRREAWILRRGSARAGFVLLELSSRGLNFSELTSAFRVYCPAEDAAARLELVAHARRRYAQLGHARCVGLGLPCDEAAFVANGFSRAKRYACWTWHRSLLGELRQHVLSGAGHR